MATPTTDRPWAPADRRASKRDGSERRPPDYRVFNDPGWLPDGEPLDGLDLDGMDDLRERHHELLSARADARRTVSDLRAQYAAEDQKVGDHWEAGGKGEPPVVTDQAVRSATIQAAQEVADTAEADLMEFAREALATVAQRQPLISAQIEAHGNRLAERRAELTAELNKLGQESLQVTRLRTWTRRMTAAIPGTLLPWRLLFESPMAEDGSTAGHSVAAPPAGEDAHPDVTAPSGTRRFSRRTGLPSHMEGN